MEATISLKIHCNNSLAIKYAMDILTNAMMKQKLEDWKIEVVPKD